MGDPGRASSTFLTDEEKQQVLNNLRSTFETGNLTSDSKLAKSVSRITSNVEQLALAAQTTAELSFTVNLVDYTVDCVATHLETNDPVRELFHELVISDGESLYSWCPDGYKQLEEITKTCVPVRMGFEKYITLKDLEERRGEPKEAPVREKKKRTASQLSKAPVSAPKKVACTDATPTHQIHMEIVSKKLDELTRDGPVPFFRFVINPNSFVQTVYNVFIVSFLVHEEHALLSVGENDELFIQFFEHLRDSDECLDGVSTIQVVHSVSPSEWSALVKHLKLTSPMLPELCPKDSPYFQNNQLSEDMLGGDIFLNP